MGQRNMLCTSQMLDLEMGQQGQGHLRPEPYILFGNMFHYPQPNMHPILSTSGNTSNLNLNLVPDHHDSAVFYGNQFSSLQHHHPVTNIDLGVAAPPNYYNPYMIHSSGGRMCPVPPSHGSLDQLPSSGNHGVGGIDINEYEGNNHFMYGVSPAKRKNAEVAPWNCHHHVNGFASSSSSSLGITLNTGRHQWEERFESGAGVVDAAAFLQPDYRANDILSFTGGGPGRSVRSRSSTIGFQLDSTPIHTQNRLVQGNYMGQSIQQASSAWAEHHFVSNGSDGGNSTWNHAPPIPYVQGRGVNGVSLEIASMGEQGYPDTMTSRNSAILLHPSSVHNNHFHHHPPPMQPMRGLNYNYHSQASLPSHRHPTNNTLHHGTSHPSLHGLETGPRYPRSFPFNGLRIYRPNRDGARQTAPLNSNHPHLRILSEDEVAILEIPGFYEVENFTDQHRDMRLDIDDMSYEELLALGERIGNVKTGLLEETILSRLKTRIHFSSATADKDHETDTCTICQVEFENQEMIATLDCGHEYHADCIKQWLQVRNVCPICKMSALTVEGMDG